MTPPGDAPTSDIDPSFRDSSLPIEDRVERLLAQMTVPEKAGLFFHSMISIGPDGELGDGNPAFGIPSPDDLVAGRCEPLREVGADESGPAGDEHSHSSKRSEEIVTSP